MIHSVINNSLSSNLFIGRRVPFAFLSALSVSFNEQHGSDYIQPIPYSLESFSKTIVEKMDYFNRPESDEFRRVQGDLDNVKEIMIENIGNLMKNITILSSFRKSD